MLVDCPECSGRISSLADICPNCGYPVETLGLQKPPDQAPEEPPVANGSEDDARFQRSRFEGKFKKVTKEIEILREQTRLVTGCIFTSHSFSQEQLLKSERFARMDSIVKKIDDDAMNWFCANNASHVAEDTYRSIRRQVLSDIAELKREISERQPTWWENTLASVKQFLLRFGI
ncbi:MAG TPA: hypothetical protein PLU72_10000 [Candidatus Ozemobacteraceae bacterium]|nr:hypothetical protein [Candidatus Ozemobacteraceae bacterium]HQG27005.1 hypothetical protein [Candidatus Ozemobacteraceae bacterium]